MITLSPNLTQRLVSWPEFKVGASLRPGVRLQFHLGNPLTIYFYDGPEVWLCQLWEGTVPPNAGVTQEQANEYLAEWEQQFKPLANRALEARTSDSVPFVSTNIFPPWAVLYFAGCGDGAGRGDGAEFNLSRDTAGEAVLEFGFNDGVYAAGGGIGFQGAEVGDWCSMELFAPATTFTPVGSGGNCNVDPTTGLILPAAGNGTLNLVSPVPVPALDDDTGLGKGFWDWSDPWTGKGTVTPGTPFKSKWYLVAGAVPLARFVSKLQLLGNGTVNITIPTIKPKYLLPHWRWKLTLHNHTGHAGLKVTWWVVLARKTGV